MKIKLSYIILILGVFLSSGANAVINMAVIAPRAGELKPFGDELVQGAQIAVEDINAQGGINGERINLIIVDDQCDDSLAISTAQMMAVNSTPEDKMHMVIGPYCQNSFSQVADIYARAKIFQIIPTAVSSQNTSHKQGGLVKLLGKKERQGEDVFNFYEQNFEGNRLALVYDSGIREVVDIAAALQQEFRNRDLSKYLGTFNFADYEDDYEKMATEILNMGASVAYILGNSEDIENLSHELKHEDEEFIIFTNRYQVDTNYIESMGNHAKGTYMVGLPSLKNNPDFTETLVKMRLLGIEPEGLGVYSYSAVKLWQNLAVQNKSFQYDKLAHSIETERFITPWGEIMFNEGIPDIELNYGIYQIKDNGEYTQVY